MWFFKPLFFSIKLLSLTAHCVSTKGRQVNLSCNIYTVFVPEQKQDIPIIFIKCIHKTYKSAFACHRTKMRISASRSPFLYLFLLRWGHSRPGWRCIIYLTHWRDRGPARWASCWQLFWLVLQYAVDAIILQGISWRYINKYLQEGGYQWLLFLRVIQ